MDEQLPEEALRLSGERTYSTAVDRALSEFVRRARAGRILDMTGSGLWEGDLTEKRAGWPHPEGLPAVGSPMELVDTSVDVTASKEDPRKGGERA